MMKCVAIIPARGGSKRLPGKNLAQVGGLTLIERTARGARDSGVIGRIILSTDSAEIAREGRRAGIEVPFMRPDYLATSDAKSEAVALHAIDMLDLDNDVIVLLQPTSPLRMGRDIAGAVRRFWLDTPPAVVTVDSSGQPNGAVYVIAAKTLRDTGTFYPPGTLFKTMPDERSVDVDFAADLERAQELAASGLPKVRAIA